MKRVLGLFAAVALLGGVGCAHNKAAEEQASADTSVTVEEQTASGGSGTVAASEKGECPPGMVPRAEAEKDQCPPGMVSRAEAEEKGWIQAEDMPGSERPSGTPEEGTGGSGVQEDESGLIQAEDMPGSEDIGGSGEAGEQEPAAEPVDDGTGGAGGGGGG